MFARRIENWREEVDNRIVELHRDFLLDLFVSIVNDTPVDQGILKGNWQLEVNTNTRVLEIRDPNGTVAISRAENALNEMNPNEDFNFSIFNNSPYVLRVEFDGHSDQAPEGMFRRNYIRAINTL